MTDGNDIKRLALRVTGLVQGVFFRASTRDQARALGLVGWVRNASDGAVEIEAEGPAAAVDELAAWARRGPPSAQVDAVDVRDLEPARSESEFFVRA